MRKFTIALLFVASNLFAQDNPNETIEGVRNISVSNIPFIARQYNVLPYKIADYSYDKETHKLYIYIDETIARSGPDKKGNGVICYDMENMKQLYRYDYSGSSDMLHIVGGYILRDESLGTLIKDEKTNKEIAFLKGKIAMFSAKHKLYINTNGTAYDITTGEKRWKAEFKRKIPWRNVLAVDDDNIIVGTEGIHKLNFNTGVVWSYPMNTTLTSMPSIWDVINYSAMVFAPVGYYAKSVGPDYNHGMCSNVLVDSNNNYYEAGSDRIISVNKDGKLRWDNPLKIYNTGKSKVWSSGDTLYMLSLGYANRQNLLVRQSFPYIDAYNRNSGRLIYHKELGTNEPVIDYLIDEDNLFVRTIDLLVRFSLNKGILYMQHYVQDEDGFRNAFSIIPYKDLYRRGQDGYKPIDAKHKKSMLLLGNDKVYAINDKGEYEVCVGEDRAYRMLTVDDKEVFNSKGQSEFICGNRKVAINEYTDAIFDNRVLIVNEQSFIVAECK
ncbi:MAG: hypothetical protein JNK00_05685 [Flavipsychrobacter sp.]|nr:hypothetical protein [Flavipsychrobacter sp.]